MMFFNNVPESIEENLERLDELGGPNVFNHYAWGWTNAGQHAVPALEAGNLPRRHHRPVHRLLAGQDHRTR